jgi:hypothetical protein
LVIHFYIELMVEFFKLFNHLSEIYFVFFKIIFRHAICNGIF